jgi:hypothetical protein
MPVTGIEQIETLMPVTGNESYKNWMPVTGIEQIETLLPVTGNESYTN